MADFSVRADHIDVEQIMRQIRARIRDKRGADYTEDEIRELAAVKLEKFLDPRAVRSDLLQHYRRQNQPAPLILPEEAHPPLYEFTPETPYVSKRGLPGRILTIIRQLLKPISKLFFHVDTLWDVLSKQAVLNAQHTRLFQRTHQRLITRDELDALNFEMFNNLVVELTRLGIEVKNLRMQVESFGTRLDFDERRARALEGVVQYRPGATVARPPAPSAAGEEDEEEPIGAAGPGGQGGEGDALSRSARRRRRRRGRRRGSGSGAEGSESESDGPDEQPQGFASREPRERREPGEAEQPQGFAPREPREGRERQPYESRPPREAREPFAAAEASVETSPGEAEPAAESEPAAPPAWREARATPAPAEPAEAPFIPEPPAPPVAAEPIIPEPLPAEPQRVFHRVFDRPRDAEPAAPSQASPDETPGPGPDDHEPSQS